MNTPEFQSVCEEKRFFALRDGEGSPADRAWRKHAVNCPECSAALHIMTLLSMKDSDNCRISPGDAARLVEVAKNRYRDGEVGVIRFLMRHSWKVAAICIFLAGGAMLFPAGWAGDKGVQIFASRIKTASMLGFTTERTVETSALSANKSAGNVSGSGVAPSVAAAGESGLPEIIPANPVDNQIRQVRYKVERQFDELNSLIDRDLTGY